MRAAMISGVSPFVSPTFGIGPLREQKAGPIWVAPPGDDQRGLALVAALIDHLEPRASATPHRLGAVALADRFHEGLAVRHALRCASGSAQRAQRPTPKLPSRSLFICQLPRPSP